MFTDIRGFTAFTGAAGSRRVIELLNEYFGEVIDAILAHRGTLVGYRGDGVLAVFGPRSRSPTTPTAPSRRRGRCSTCACRASTAGCAIAASAMASGWGSASTAGRSYPATSARLGSARRLEHTVHGDTVDTASRLEGMTKDLGRSTLMSDATCWALAHRPDGLDFVGEFDVRGRRSAISPRLRFALIDAPCRFAAVSGRSPRAGVRRATAAAPTPRTGCPARSS